MFGFVRSPRTCGTVARGLTILSLELLCGRECLSAALEVSAPDAGYTATSEQFPAAQFDDAPYILNFQAEQIGNGLFMFTGLVIDEDPEGLEIVFGGSVSSVRSRVAYTDANGNFTLILQLNTDGTDSGLVTVSTVDAEGQSSNEPFVHVSPTP